MKRSFFQSETFPGALIFGSVVLSLVIANTPLGGWLQAGLGRHIGYEGTVVHLRYAVQSWINDGLMAVFFLLIGLEVKREVISGDLSTPKKALLPILCAAGGAVMPAMIYSFINRGLDTQGGWGIPMATDIAFALAIISLLGRRVPSSLKVFLATLAIVDDLIAILVIALFYAGDIHVSYLLYAAGCVLLLAVLHRLKVRWLIGYLVPGAVMWYFIHHSGVHATIAGVLTAAFIPAGAGQSPLRRLEHALTKPVNLVIVPLFAFANTNIGLGADMIGGLASAPGLGIILGLLVGKPVGVLLTAYISTKAGVGHLPERAGWRHIVGLGFLAGIGFTMSIFLALLSFSDAGLVAQVKLAVLAASLVAGSVGYAVLARGGG